MKILFIADKLIDFHIKKDTTFDMMREACRRGLDVFHCGPQHLSWSSAQGVQANAQQIRVKETQVPLWWKEIQAPKKVPLHQFAVVLMRKDPPFDRAYVDATHLLEKAEKEGACVLNRPSALRNHPEKLALMEFAHWAPPTLVARSKQEIQAFHQEHRDIILKPLDGMGGKGIFRISAEGLNLSSTIEMLTQDEHQAIMAQAYVPAIEHGDKRILLIGGKVVPYALVRMAQKGEVRANLAAGGRAVVRAINEDEKKMAETLAPLLWSRGLFLVGLDIIGDRLTEINVTSPTGFQEITQQSGFSVAGFFFDTLQMHLETMRS